MVRLFHLNCVLNSWKTSWYIKVWKSTTKCDHAQNISWNQLFSNFFSKNVDLTEKLLVLQHTGNDKKFTHTEKKIRQINYLAISLVKILPSRNFCQKRMRVNSRNFHTVWSRNNEFVLWYFSTAWKFREFSLTYFWQNILERNGSTKESIWRNIFWWGNFFILPFCIFLTLFIRVQKFFEINFSTTWKIVN